jgi:2-phosphoglycerate kinase
MVNGSYVMVEDSQGLLLPYSKGLMSTSIMAAGVEPEDAFALAESIEEQLLDEGRDKIAASDLSALAAHVLSAWGGEELGRKYLRWRHVKASNRPIVVFIGGTTGVGKSTVATKIAARLGITRVIATDAVREVMRNIFMPDLLPTVHYSSFDAERALRAPVPDGHDPALVGFRQQAEAVSVGLRGLVDRACREGTGVIVEGVHALPGLFADASAAWKSAASVSEVILVAPDREAHMAQFYSRASEGQGRDPNRYLEHFGNIRKIQRYIRRLAEKHGVAEVHSRSLDETIQDVLDLVVVQVAEGQ